jgi:hypothetical protein
MAAQPRAALITASKQLTASAPLVGCRGLILIEAPSSADRRGMLALGKATQSRGGDLMRFYTKQHKAYCGIDLHARTMYVCILSHDGEILLHRRMKAAPEPFLKAVAPYREGLVVAVACLCTWDLARRSRR